MICFFWMLCLYTLFWLVRKHSFASQNRNGRSVVVNSGFKFLWDSRHPCARADAIFVLTTTRGTGRPNLWPFLVFFRYWPAFSRFSKTCLRPYQSASDLHCESETARSLKNLKHNFFCFWWWCLTTQFFKILENMPPTNSIWTPLRDSEMAARPRNKLNLCRPNCSVRDPWMPGSETRSWPDLVNPQKGCNSEHLWKSSSSTANKLCFWTVRTVDNRIFRRGMTGS